MKISTMSRLAPAARNGFKRVDNIAEDDSIYSNRFFRQMTITYSINSTSLFVGARDNQLI